MSAATSLLPLITHPTPRTTLAWVQGQPISASQFLSDARRLAATYPAGRHILNICHDRYHFAVGLAAALISGKVSLLPSTLTQETVQQLNTLAPDLFCLTDQASERPALPCIDYPAGHAADSGEFDLPLIDSGQLVALVFTSGSTGTPVPHPKHWGALVKNVQSEALQLGLCDGGTHTILGTVPAQHMYGFESTVLLALQSGQALLAERPFYPADIIQAIKSAPQPPLLVTTPFHLKSLLASGGELPPVEMIISATAPLSQQLAAEAERRMATQLREIYGSTETGQIATRRPVAGPQWQLLSGIELHADGEQRIWASGGHVERAVVMNDVIELLEDNRFLLHGRTADLINIAGKRSSLSYLNHQLNSIAGVVDGTFFMPDEESPDGVTRLQAIVVAPGLDSSALQRELRTRIDSAFMPRPILFVEALPRSANGKLPREALKQLIQNHRCHTLCATEEP